MPGKDGTGPDGKGPFGRRRGLCRDTNIPAGEAAKSPGPDVYGVGRGGKPRGCGMGRLGRRRTG